MKIQLPVFLLILSYLFPPQVSAQVLINEFLPNSSQEWVEFYNAGSSTEDLSNYYFDDDTNFDSDAGSSAKIPLSGLLPTLSMCYLDLSTFLNNNGDFPTVFKIDKTQIDTYFYTTTTSDKSYSRVPDGGSWAMDQSPTKSIVRCSDSAPTPTPTPTPTDAPASTPIVTPSPTTTPTKTPVPTPTKSPTPKPTKSATPTSSESPSEVLGTTTESSPDAIVSPDGDAEKKKLPLLPVVFIVSGVLMVGFAVYNLVRARKNPVQT